MKSNNLTLCIFLKVSDNEEKKYKRQKKSSRSKFTSDDSNMQMSESLSEVR
jgi:hypothetical protein